MSAPHDPHFDDERATIFVLLSPVVGFLLGAGGLCIWVALTTNESLLKLFANSGEGALARYITLCIGGIGAGISLAIAIVGVTLGYVKVLIARADLAREEEEQKMKK